MKLLARQFEILLVVTGLKLSTAGETGILYSLRHSSIMFRLLFGRTVDTLTLARNARTSPEMVDLTGLARVAAIAVIVTTK